MREGESALEEPQNRQRGWATGHHALRLVNQGQKNVTRKSAQLDEAPFHSLLQIFKTLVIITSYTQFELRDATKIANGL